MASKTVGFTGTSTGDRYNVGQNYRMGNDSYRANADGTFTNNRTGNSLVGSSQDPNVTFYQAQSLVSSSSGGGGGGSGPATSTVNPTANTAGPGRAHVNTGGAHVATSGPGNQAVASGNPATARRVATALQSPFIPSADRVGPFATPFLPTAGQNAPEEMRGPGGTGVQVGDLYIVPQDFRPAVEDFWEPQYGEPGEWVGGITNMVTDAIFNVPRIFKDTIVLTPGGIADRLVNGPGANPNLPPIPTNNPMWPENYPANETPDRTVKWGNNALSDAINRDLTSGPGMLTTPNYGY